MTRVVAMIADPYDRSVSTAVDGLPGLPGLPGTLGAGTGRGEGFTVRGGTVPVYVSDAGYVSHANDDPPNRHFPPVLARSFSLQVSAFAGQEPSGRSRAGAGTVEIINDGSLDGLTELAWDGRAVRLFVGDSGQPFSSFQLVYQCTVDGMQWNEEGISLNLADRQLIFDQPLQSDLFDGTGGLAGSEELSGRAKPQVYGAFFNVAPVLIDPLNLIYQIHDRQMAAVSAVRDNGAGLQPAGEVSALGLDEVGDWSPGSPDDDGTFITDLSRGLIRLASSPVGQITCDGRGDAAGGYVETTADIVRRIALGRGPSRLIVEPTGLDQAAFDDLNGKQPAPIQYVAKDGVTMARAFDELLGPIGGFWGFTRDGRFTVGRLDVPALANATITEKDIVEAGLSREPMGRASWRRQVGWKLNNHPQPVDGLAAVLSESEKETYSAEIRFATAENINIRTENKLAEPFSIHAFFTVEADAQAEAERQLAFYGAEPGRWRVPLIDGLFRYWVGDVALRARGRPEHDRDRDFGRRGPQ